jgi:hypothetical protein
MGKWKKKLRKFAKKAIPVIGLGLAATALARKRATDAPGDAHAKAKRLLTSDAAYAPKVDIVPEKKPVETDKKHWWDAPWPRMAKGGRVGVGKAKRGFSKLLRKK